MSETRCLFIRRSQNHFSPQSAYPFTSAEEQSCYWRAALAPLTGLLEEGGKDCMELRNASKAKNQAMKHSPRLRQIQESTGE